MTGVDDLRSEFEVKVRAFVAAGNHFEGDISTLNFPDARMPKLVWQGVENTLKVGQNVTLGGSSLFFTGAGGQIDFGKGAVLNGKFTVHPRSRISIGARSRFNKASFVQAGEGANITIGVGCLFADISIRTSDLHSILEMETGRRTNLAKGVVLHDHVWVAEKAYIYKGVTIGQGAIVGAHAIVKRDVPAYSIVAGNPAKVVKENVTWTRRTTGPEGDFELVTKLRLNAN